MGWWWTAASALLPLVPILAVFGNGLVMIAVYRERSLQTVTNWLIVSLAVSDFLVAICVMSFGVYFQMNGFVWGLGSFWCNVYLAADVACSTASILNLLAISLDRFMAISHPIAYAQHGSRGGRALISITIVWGVSVAVGLPILFGVNPPDADTTCEFSNPYFNILSSLFSFFIPCTAMILLYTVIFRRLRQREHARSMRKATKQENDRISSALLGGARIASQMGKHFKHRTDQILLEISFQTSSYPTLSDSSEENSSSSTNEGVRSPPMSAPPILQSTQCARAHTNTPVDANAENLGEEDEEEEEMVEPDEEMPLNEQSPEAEPHSDTQFVASDQLEEVSAPFMRSFGDHLQELFPFIDSVSRKASLDEERLRAATREETPTRIHKKGRSPSVRSSVPSTVHTSPRRNGTLPSSLIPTMESTSVGVTPSTTVLDIPKVHKPKEKLQNNMIDQYATVAPHLDFGSSVRLYRKQLWKRVTSGWKARPSRQLVKKATKQMRREHKATVTLAVVLVVFLGCWLPFFSIHFANSVCVLTTGDSCVHSLAFFFTTWLGYINSSLNPLIYTVFDQRFRKAFHNILLCNRKRK